MPTPVRIMPSLLLKGNRLVKGVRYKDYRDAGAPASTARIYDAQGADELTLLDITASRERRPPDIAILKKLSAECATPLTFGGGITSLAIAKDALASGADKLSVTTTAFENPHLIDTLAHNLGRQAVVVGIDVVELPGELKLYDHRDATLRTETVADWLARVQELGAGEIRLSFVNREGTRDGLAAEWIQRLRPQIDVPLVVEGGAGNLDHVDGAFALDIDGLSLGTMLIFSDNNIVQIKRHLEARKRNIRLW